MLKSMQNIGSLDVLKKLKLTQSILSYHNNCIDCSTIPKLEAFCQNTTHIVPKVIWMKDLRDIEEVMSDPSKF